MVELIVCGPGGERETIRSYHLRRGVPLPRVGEELGLIGSQPRHYTVTRIVHRLPWTSNGKEVSSVVEIHLRQWGLS